MMDDVQDAEEVKNPYRLMTFVYVASLTVIAILSIITHLVLEEVIEEQSKTGALVNISGQQRMLSQRASMFTIEYLKTGSKTAKALAVDALNTMHKNNAYLLEEHYSAIEQKQVSPMSADMHALYFAEPAHVNQQLEQFSQLINDALQQTALSDDDSILHEKEFLAMAKEPFLKALNDVVTQYESESLDKVGTLSFAQDVVLSIVILTILAEAVFVFRPMVRRVSQFAKRLQREANYDHLSGIYNRRAFFMITQKLMHSALRYKKSCSILLIDIDKFKSVNDNYGHDAGDIVIKKLAEVLTSSVRESDIVSRFGGEEYVVFLPETSLENAAIAAEKIRRVVESTEFKTEDTLLSISVSIGVEECALQKPLDASIKVADERLYFAKNNGRNQVCFDSVSA